MKYDMHDQENLKEEVLNDVSPEVNAPEMDEEPPVERPQGALDDSERVKVLSPSMLVFKRFIRNKLAIIGTAILLFMFAFCFIGGWAGKYRQEQVFHKYDVILFDYGSGSERTELVNYYYADEYLVPNSIRFSMNTITDEMISGGLYSKTIVNNGVSYYILRDDDDLFRLQTAEKVSICTAVTQCSAAVYNSAGDGSVTYVDGYTLPSGTKAGFLNAIKANSTSDSFVYSGHTYGITSKSKFEKNITELYSSPVVTYDEDVLDSGFETALGDNINNSSFVYNSNTYEVKSSTAGVYTVTMVGDMELAFISTRYAFDYYDETYPSKVTTTQLNAFEKELFHHLHDSADYVIDGSTYRTKTVDGKFVVYKVTDAETAFANVSTFVARRYNGEDSMSIAFKAQFESKVNEMIANNEQEGTFTFYMALIDEEGNPLLNYTPVYDKNGQQVVDGDGNPVYEGDGSQIYYEAEFEILRKTNTFTLRNMQSKYLIDIYAAPSTTHLLGTDANGMDVLTRIMYGGRISLLIGFIVIFLEIFIGMILGGIAGYCGKWVDNLIMRLVDIFNCIPTMPILIIMGALFDGLRLDSYTRIMYLMIILGVLGWPGIARLVRGQILSLREQEFMIAAEATGIRASRKIFRHLIPNVMPQLIVNATMGLGSIIITESTLSFLGLGAKYPLATWGAMINSVSSPAAMVSYTYIWIPVGLLICLTVIAFNFVGDGLRDAFDPKMKR